MTMEEILSRACSEAEIYKKCGVHGVMVENMHDLPYLRGGVGSEVTACMTRIASEVRKVVSGMLLGVQILSCEQAVAVVVVVQVKPRVKGHPERGQTSQ